MEEKEVEINSLLEYVKEINNFNIEKIYSILIDNLQQKINQTERDIKQNYDIENKDRIIDYIDYVISIMRHKSKSYKLFYRGDIYKDYDVPYPLASGIYRSNVKHDEYYFFNNIQVQCAKNFQNMSNLDKLVYMQHYGCPTRLLDITSNPLVALYFACMPIKPNKTYEENAIGGCVNVFAVSEKEILFSLSDRILMLTKFAEFNKFEQNKICKVAEDAIASKTDKFHQKTNQEYLDDNIERFYHAVKTSNPAFKRKIKPIDLLQPQFVQPLKNNDRILKQDGAFIISGLDHDEEDSNNKISQNIIKKYVIREAKKKDILEELEKFGICQATLFPEVSEVAEYLKNKS